VGALRADRDSPTADFTYPTSTTAPRSTDLRGHRRGRGAGFRRVIRTRGDGIKTLAFASAVVKDGKVEEGYYELDAAARLRRVDDEKAHEYTKKTAPSRGGDLSMPRAFS
jgi:hypothetical protein